LDGGDVHGTGDKDILRHWEKSCGSASGFRVCEFWFGLRDVMMTLLGDIAGDGVGDFSGRQGLG
jgi:hypothetical protein